MRTSVIDGRRSHGFTSAQASGDTADGRRGTTLHTTLLLCGVLSAAVYVATDVLAAKLYPGFSYTDQAVSELFAIGAPTSGLVVPLFTLSSALMLPFALGVWSLGRVSRAQRALAVVIALSAIDALVLWNVFPMHMRGAERTMTDTMHLALATNPFVPASWILAAVAFRGRFRTFTFVLILVILALAFYGFSFAPEIAANEPTPWMGLSERAGQYLGMVWQTALAVMLLRTSEMRPT